MAVVTDKEITMKYLVLMTLVLVCRLSTTVWAQEASAPVVAEVSQAVLLITSSGQTSFGNIDNFAHTEIIDPKAPTSNQTTAQFTFAGSNGGNVVFACPSEVTLTEPVSSAVMTFTPQLSWSGSFNDPSTSFPISCTEFGGVFGGETWFWLGGSLVLGADQAPGSYSGVFTLSVAYNQ